TPNSALPPRTRKISDAAGSSENRAGSTTEIQASVDRYGENPGPPATIRAAGTEATRQRSFPSTTPLPSTFTTVAVRGAWGAASALQAVDPDKVFSWILESVFELWVPIQRAFTRFGVVIGAQHLPAGIRQHQTRIEARTQLLGVHVEYETLICLSIETVDILV